MNGSYNTQNSNDDDLPTSSQYHDQELAGFPKVVPMSLGFILQVVLGTAVRKDVLRCKTSDCIHNTFRVSALSQSQTTLKQK